MDDAQWIDTKCDDLGLSVDMLDVDWLRASAHNILTHGADISYWASCHHVVSKLQILATNVEQAIRDIGTLRSEVARLQAHTGREGRLRVALEQYGAHDIERCNGGDVCTCGLDAVLKETQDV